MNSDLNIKCNLCRQKSEFIFQSKILGKYLVNYFQCSNCDYIQSEKPFWLKEAYKDPINKCDTGILMRNDVLIKISAVIIYFLLGNNKKLLDYSGGYGIATRMLRDIGFDAYWDDPMTTNVFAKGFEYNKKIKIDVITSFESFEHFADPIKELENMLKITNNIIFSTELLPEKTPNPKKWWYYGFEHGQHISFYSEKTFNYIARKFGLNYYSLGSIGILSAKKISSLKLKMVVRLSDILYSIVKKNMVSLTLRDMEYIINE